IWRETGEDFGGGGAVLLHPDRVVVRHGLAPVGHGEVGVEALRLAEGVAGLVVLEGVEEQEAAEERRLGLRGAGVREIGFPEGLGLERSREDDEQEEGSHGWQRRGKTK